MRQKVTGVLVNRRKVCDGCIRSLLSCGVEVLGVSRSWKMYILTNCNYEDEVHIAGITLRDGVSNAMMGKTSGVKILGCVYKIKKLR